MRDILRDSTNQLWVSVVNVGEVYYRIVREEDEVRAQRTVQRLANQVTLIDVDRTFALEAAAIKVRFPLSYADCFAAALARRFGATVVTGDPEFRPLEDHGIIAVEWLEPKPRSSR